MQWHNILQEMHPYHITYLSNLLPILEKEELYSKNWLEKEGIGHRDPTNDLIEDSEEKQLYLNSERIEKILKIEIDELRELDRRAVRNGDSLGDYVRLYILNSEFLPPYAYRFIINTIKRHEGILFLVFKPISELLQYCKDYIMIFGSAFSKYRKICSDLNTFVRVAFNDLNLNLRDYITALIGSGLKYSDALREVSQWFFHSEIDFFNCLPLKSLEFLVAFTFDDSERIVSYPKIEEIPNNEFIDNLRKKSGYNGRYCYYILNKSFHKLNCVKPEGHIFDDFCSTYLSLVGVPYPERRRFREVSMDFRPFRVAIPDVRTCGIIHQLNAKADPEEVVELIANYINELLALFNGGYLYLWE